MASQTNTFVLLLGKIIATPEGIVWREYKQIIGTSAECEIAAQQSMDPSLLLVPAIAATVKDARLKLDHLVVAMNLRATGGWM